MMEEKIRGLSLVQVDMLNAILSSEKKVISSSEVIKNLKIGSGQSVSALASLSVGNKPLVKKMGKRSAREGILWMFNDADYDRKEAVKAIKGILADWDKVGGIETLNN